jgi:hypothetical protein
MEDDTSSVKVNWEIDPEYFLERANDIAQAARSLFDRQGIQDANNPADSNPESGLRRLDPEADALLITNMYLTDSFQLYCYSARPLLCRRESL